MRLPEVNQINEKVEKKRKKRSPRETRNMMRLKSLRTKHVFMNVTKRGMSVGARVARPADFTHNWASFEECCGKF